MPKATETEIHPLEELTQWLPNFYSPLFEIAREIPPNLETRLAPGERGLWEELETLLGAVRKLKPAGARLADEIDQVVLAMHDSRTEIAIAIAGVFFLKFAGYTPRQIREIGTLAGLARQATLKP